MSPDIKRLGELFEELRRDHAPVYWFAVVFTALGVMGMVCLLDALIGGPK